MNANIELSPTLRAGPTGFDYEMSTWMAEKTQGRLPRSHQENSSRSAEAPSKAGSREAVEQTSDSARKNLLARSLKLWHRALGAARLVLRSPRSTPRPRTSLETALRGLREDLPFDCTVAYRLFVAGRPVALHPDSHQQVYLIAQEAVTNALRHSHATTIEVDVEYLGRHLRLAVRDNGCGFDSGKVRSECDSDMGLQAMCARAEAIGARLKVWTRDGVGTEIELSVPIRYGQIHPIDREPSLVRQGSRF